MEIQDQDITPYTSYYSKNPHLFYHWILLVLLTLSRDTFFFMRFLGLINHLLYLGFSMLTSFMRIRLTDSDFEIFYEAQDTQCLLVVRVFEKGWLVFLMKLMTWLWFFALWVCKSEWTLFLSKKIIIYLLVYAYKIDIIISIFDCHLKMILLVTKIDLSYLIS